MIKVAYLLLVHAVRRVAVSRHRTFNVDSSWRIFAFAQNVPHLSVENREIIFVKVYSSAYQLKQYYLSRLDLIIIQTFNYVDQRNVVKSRFTIFRKLIARLLGKQRISRVARIKLLAI